MADSPTNERQQQCHLASVISLLCLQALHITTLLRHVWTDQWESSGSADLSGRDLQFNDSACRFPTCGISTRANVPASASRRRVCWWRSTWTSRSREGRWWSPRRWCSGWCQGKGRRCSDPSIRRRHLNREEEEELKRSRVIGERLSKKRRSICYFSKHKVHDEVLALTFQWFTKLHNTPSNTLTLSLPPTPGNSGDGLRGGTGEVRFCFVFIWSFYSLNSKPAVDFTSIYKNYFHEWLPEEHLCLFSLGVTASAIFSCWTNGTFWKEFRTWDGNLPMHTKRGIVGKKKQKTKRLASTCVTRRGSGSYSRLTNSFGLGAA